MQRKAYVNDISNCYNTELFNIGLWKNNDKEINSFNDASVNLESYILKKLEINDEKTEDRILIINPSVNSMTLKSLHQAYFLFTSMERYEKNINLIKKHNLSVSLLNLDGTIPYADGYR